MTDHLIISNDKDLTLALHQINPYKIQKNKLKYTHP